MGMGYSIKCDKCNYEFDLLNDYGGIYDWETYNCLDCKEYFSVRTYNTNLVSWKEVRKPGFFNAIRKKTKIVQTFKTWDKLECEYCKSKTVKRIYDKEIVNFEGFKIDGVNKTYLNCPKCNNEMIATVLFFDD